MAGREYRVTYRRTGWGALRSKSRRFARRVDAERWATLIATDVEELGYGELEYVRVDERDVGRWREVQQ